MVTIAINGQRFEVEPDSIHFESPNVYNLVANSSREFEIGIDPLPNRKSFDGFELTIDIEDGITNFAFWVHNKPELLTNDLICYQRNRGWLSRHAGFSIESEYQALASRNYVEFLSWCGYGDYIVRLQDVKNKVVPLDYLRICALYISGCFNWTVDSLELFTEGEADNRSKLL